MPLGLVCAQRGAEACKEKEERTYVGLIDFHPFIQPSFVHSPRLFDPRSVARQNMTKSYYIRPRKGAKSNISAGCVWRERRSGVNTDCLRSLGQCPSHRIAPSSHRSLSDHSTHLPSRTRYHTRRQLDLRHRKHKELAKTTNGQR